MRPGSATSPAEIAAVPGVAHVQTRVASVVTLDLPDLSEPAQGRVVSIDERAGEPLNDLFLIRGRTLERGSDEVIVSGAFADANGLNPGDTLRAVMNGRLRQLQIVGVALSPEYIYEIRPGDIFPDNRRFGVLWMNRRSVAAVFQMENAFNDLALRLAPEGSEKSVIEAVDRILAPYGGFGAYGRSDQTSHRFVSNELDELRVFGTFLPAIFLGVTAFLLHLVLSRLVNVEREQIGLLKAFGYSNRDVGMHYLKLAVAAILGGILLGILLGAWIGPGSDAQFLGIDAISPFGVTGVFLERIRRANASTAAMQERLYSPYEHDTEIIGGLRVLYPAFRDIAVSGSLSRSFRYNRDFLRRDDVNWSLQLEAAWTPPSGG
mgnify:CR=1 FL=1